MGVSEMIIGVFGTGGMGREAMEIAKTIDSFENVELYFVVDEEYKKEDTINGIQVLTTDEFIEIEGKKFFNVAIGNSKSREKVTDLFYKNKLFRIDLNSKLSFISSSAYLDYGSIVMPFSSISTNTGIGKGLILNTGARIAHDCVICDWVTISPNAVVNGHVHIGNHVFIGSGAIIRNGTPDKPLVIGDGAFIEMGAIVTGDVPANARVRHQLSETVTLQDD